MKLLRKALSVNKTYVPALITMGELLTFKGRSQKAKLFYEEALKLDRDQTVALKGLIRACYNIKEKNECVKHIEIILRQKEDLEEV